MKLIHLYQLEIDLNTEQYLLSLTQRHLKLAVEHGHRQTTPHRRTEIKLFFSTIVSGREW